MVIGFLYTPSYLFDTTEIKPLSGAPWPPTDIPSHPVQLPELTAPFGLHSREMPKRPESWRLGLMHGPESPRSWTDGSRN